MMPAAPVLSGSQVAAGILFPAGLPESLLRRRVLANWQAGARLYRLEAGHLLLFAEPRRLRAALVPGYCVVRHALVYTSMPLTKDLLQELAPPPESVVHQLHGVMAVESLSEQHRVDPAMWLDVSAFALCAVETLGERPAPISIEAKAKGLHDALGLPEPVEPPAKLSFLQSLLSGGGSAALKSGALGKLGGMAAVFRFPLLGAMSAAGALGALGAMLGGGLKGSRLPGGSLTPRARTTASGGPSLLRRTLASAQNHLHWLFLQSFMEGRYSRYLNDLFSKFESGNLDEALRHAIPLGGESNGSLQQLLKPLWLLPMPRFNLGFGFVSSSVTSLMTVGEAMEARLRQTYMSAHEKLHEQGRLPEAAWVLAELLQDPLAAVNYLERVGLVSEAAELAILRKLSPALIVRLLIMAGNIEAALSWVYRAGTFSTAISLLAVSHPEEAEKLRVVWATTLAAAGQYATAYDIAVEVKALHPLAQKWADLAIEQGGETAARMVVRMLARFPERAMGLEGQVRGLAETLEPSEIPSRMAFIQEITGQPEKTPAIRSAARIAYRALARDISTAALPDYSGDSRRLITLLRDAGSLALKADAVRPDNILTGGTRPPAPRLCEQTAPQEIVLKERGRRSGTHEAVVLPEGRLLVAAGEDGVFLLDRRGRTQHHFPVPATRLVLSEERNRAIAVVPGSHYCRATLLDLGRRLHRPLRDLPITLLADSFDGRCWLVSDGTRVILLDVLGAEPRPIWEAEKIEGHVIALVRGHRAFAFLTQAEDSIFAWTCPVAALTTLERHLLRAGPLRPFLRASPTSLRANLRIARLQYAFPSAIPAAEPEEGTNDAANPSATTRSQAASAMLLLEDFDRFTIPGQTELGLVDLSGPLPGGAVVVSSRWIAASHSSQGGCVVYLVDASERLDGKVRCIVRFPHATELRVRLFRDELVLADDSGAVWLLNLSGAEADVRLHASC